MLARGLCILRCFGPGESELPLSEIARRAELPKATAHRLVAELVTEGLLERGEKGIRLGVALFVLGARVPGQIKFRDLAFPYAEKLHHLTRGSAFVFISGSLGPDAALVDAVRRAHGTGGGLRAEERRASAQAATRVFRAFGGAGTPPHPDAEGNGGETDRVRQRGIAAVRGPGTVGVAAPVLAASGTAAGALAVAAPEGRMQVVTAASYLRAACAAVSRALRNAHGPVPRP
ncbi:IclR family transcriptional regulator [Streptomyces clavuligerus]|nr:IclR family transcriptional regulator [Streptomyces clavuligerus]AXU16167.1 MarR family transcriptional regulator [Streptomyces clavuligerus]QCS08947.1 IclR family transcriptional regulator [Streptomyces clavuligerus]